MPKKATLNPFTGDLQLLAKPAGVSGEIQFNNIDFGSDSNLFWDNVNKRLGIGTTTPASKLDVNGTTTSITYNATDEDDVLQVDGDTIMHFYHHKDANDTNMFIGKGSGNYTLAPTGNAWESSGNTGIGALTLWRITDGWSNTALGSEAGGGITTGFKNMLLGDFAGRYISTGNANICIGRDAGVKIVNGDSNIAIGVDTIKSGNGDKFKNVAIGYESGEYITIGNNNTFIGTESGHWITSGSDNLFLGYYSGYNQTTNSDLLIIDNQDRTSAALEATKSLIYGVFDTDTAKQKLKVNGAISSNTKTFSTTGPTDNVDVTGVNTLWIDTSSNNVTIGGFAGGVNGQMLRVVRLDSTNSAILEHNEGGGSQDIFLKSEADETLATYGGWVLMCDGSNWYDSTNTF